MSQAQCWPRKVAVDLSGLGTHLTGIERCSIEILSAMTQTLDYSELDRISVIGPWEHIPSTYRRDLGNVGEWINLSETRRMSAYMFGGPKALLRVAPDVVFFPMFPPSVLSSVGLLRGTRWVRLMYDTFAWTHKDTTTWKTRLLFGPLDKAARHKYDRVLTLSHAAAKDLSEVFPDLKDRMRVIGAGMSSSLGSNLGLGGKTAAQGLNVLCVGTIEPRKNYKFILRVVANLIREGCKCNLTIVGRRGWQSEEVDNEIEALDLKSSVQLVSDADDHELGMWYRWATVVAVPSVSEGFGLSALEAIGYQTIPIVSDNGALPEVVGKLGIIRPLQVDNWVGVLRGVASGAIRVELKEEECRRHLDQFRWIDVARRTWDAIETLGCPYDTIGRTQGHGPT